MTPRDLAKHAAFAALGSPPVVAAKLRRIRHSGALTILNLHRVAEPDGSAYPPLRPKLFEALLSFAKRHFEIVTFAGLARATVGRPKLILSFDDGYRDFHSVAAPIMARHGVQANLNVIPAAIESGLPPLNVILQDFIGRAPAERVLALDIPGFTMPDRLSSRLDLGNRVSAFLKAKPIAEQKSLAEPLTQQTFGVAGFAPTGMMTMAELREVARVHEIGAHSFEHANMAVESDDYLRNDLKLCHRWLAEELDLPMTVYAFPNGSYRASQLDILRAAEIEQVLLVDEDFSSPRSATHKRFTFDGNSRAEVRFRATGAFRWPRAA